MVQLDPADPPGRLGEWLRAVGADVEVRDLSGGDSLPDDPGVFGGVVVLGGKMAASDDAGFPFLPSVRELLRSVVSDETPTLGVCLGAQLLALANGGRVAPMPDGPELGAQLIAKRTAAARDPLFGPVPITPDVVQWHYDEVTALPSGAVHLAGSPMCDNQAFRVGRLAWGIQFHIESTPDVVAGWARADAADLGGYDLDAIVARAAAVHADVEEVWAPFVAAFVDVVLDPAAVAPPPGVPTSTAAPVTDPAAIRAALAAEAGEAREAPTSLPMPTMPPGRPRSRE